MTIQWIENVNEDKQIVFINGLKMSVMITIRFWVCILTLTRKMGDVSQAVLESKSEIA